VIHAATTTPAVTDPGTTSMAMARKITAAQVFLDVLENPMPASKLEYHHPALGLIERLQRRKRKLRLAARTADYLGKRRSCLAKRQRMNTGYCLSACFCLNTACSVFLQGPPLELTQFSSSLYGAAIRHWRQRRRS